MVHSKTKVSDFLFEHETYLIRAACFEVWNAFGGAFKEKIIDRALTEALCARGLSVEDQKRMDIFFRGKKVGTYVPDKIVNNSIIVELKAKPYVTASDIDQFWKYWRGSEYKLGLLIMFTPEKLFIKRIVYDRARTKKISVQSA